MTDTRIIHDGSFVHPGGGARVAREITTALDAPITVAHTSQPEFWSEVDVDFPFQERFHTGLSGVFYDHLPVQYGQFRTGQLFRSLDFDEDILVSTSTYSKWIIPRHDQYHVHYANAHPLHFYSKPKSGHFSWSKSFLTGLVDQYFTGFCDAVIANSELTRSQIAKHYGYDARVVNPPVRTDEFYHSEPDANDPYFVMISRLVPRKRVALVARVFADISDAQLVVIGDGPLRSKCERFENVDVLGDLPDSEVERLVAESLGGIAFGENEFCGLTPKEYQAAGKPVIVPDEPNLCNHVEDGQTGVVVPASEMGLREGIDRILGSSWDSELLQEVASEWSVENFHANIRNTIRELVE